MTSPAFLNSLGHGIQPSLGLLGHQGRPVQVDSIWLRWKMMLQRWNISGWWWRFYGWWLMVILWLWLWSFRMVDGYFMVIVIWLKSWWNQIGMSQSNWNQHCHGHSDLSVIARWFSIVIWLMVEPTPSEKYESIYDGFWWLVLVNNGYWSGWWLSLPLWKNNDLVSWDDDIPNWMEKENSCSKPPTRYQFYQQEKI